MTASTLAMVGTAAAILAAVMLLLASLKSGAAAEMRSDRAAAERARIRADMQSGLGGVRSDLQDGLGGTRSDLQSGLAAANADREAIRTEMRQGFAAVLSRLPAADETAAADMGAESAGLPPVALPVAAKSDGE